MFTSEEKSFLRGIAKELRHAAGDPANEEKRAFWRRHTALKAERPAIFVFPDGAWDELMPVSELRCSHPYAKRVEYELRTRLIRSQILPDDVPAEPTFFVEKVVHNTMWGIEPRRIQSGQNGGSWHHEPVIETPADWSKLSMPRVEYDEQETKERLECVGDLLSDVLDVSLTGIKQVDFHILHYYCDFRGLENMYMDLILEPEAVHSTIRFFTDGLKSMFLQYEEQNLLSMNNDGTFHYTGGIGYTDDLPNSPSFDPLHIRLCDMWGAAEAQEFSSVSPEMHEEFILQYERELLELFGLNGYGCCDDLSKKLDGVLKIKNLRRVAVCPYADIAEFTPRLKKDYMMTWKPQPSYLAHEELGEEEICKELHEGLAKAKGGVIELVLRDTHTCRKQPGRFTRWIELAREAIAEVWG